MIPLVVDASAVADYLLHGEGGPDVRDRLTAEEADLHLPALCDVEMIAVLRRFLREGKISERRSGEAWRSYLDLPVTKHGHGPLLARALALRANFTAYDAMYVALAELLGAALLTTDRRLARAARRHTSLEVLPAAR